MKKLFSVFSFIALSILVFSIVSTTIEPAIVGAATASDTVVVTLNVTADIAISDSAAITMSQALTSSAHTAVGTSTWNVATNNSLGYTLAVRATNTPAMTSAAASINDDQTGAPATWSVSAGDAQFGYSATGTDVSTGTWGNAGPATCSATSTANSISTSLKYKGFTTSDVTVATRSSTTTPSGVNSVVCYAVEQNGFYIPSGTYKATIIATATTL